MVTTSVAPAESLVPILVYSLSVLGRRADASFRSNAFEIVAAATDLGLAIAIAGAAFTIARVAVGAVAVGAA